MAKTSDFKNGMVILLDGALLTIDEFQHVKPGKGGAFVRTRLKNIETGAVINRTFRAGEKVEEARIETHKMQYLYNDGEHYYIMHETTYEQMVIPASLVESVRQWLKEGTSVEVLFHEDRPIGIRLPLFLDLAVTHTEPGIKGDTVSAATKPATLETGATVQVPLFINTGDVLKIDTRTSKYIERTKST